MSTFFLKNYFKYNKKYVSLLGEMKKSNDIRYFVCNFPFRGMIHVVFVKYTMNKRKD